MLSQIDNVLKFDCQLFPDKPVLVAVSGGPDSLCLFDVLDRLGYPVILAYLDHQIRAESTREAEALIEMAGSYGVPACIGKVDVPGYARREHLSIEEAARIVRYRFLFEQAESHQAQAVVTGHTADDQVETVFMHLLRGAGLEGLRGMPFRGLPNPWSDTIALVRPFLGVWKEEILNYLRERELTPFEDQTNREVRFFRNRLRHELLPVLESHAPGFRQRLWQTAQIVQADLDILEPVIAQAGASCLRERTQAWIAFDLEAIRSYPNAVIRHLLRRAALQLQPQLGEIDFAALQRACDFIRRPARSHHCDWVGGFRLVIQGQSIWLAQWSSPLPWEMTTQWPQIAGDQTLTIPGTLLLLNGWQLSSEFATDIGQAFAQAQHNQDPFQAWVDADKIQMPLSVRPRRPGDVIQLLGMHGQSVKISDLMINQKIPRAARSAWPVVVSGAQIAWAPGLRLAEPFQLTENSRSAIRLNCR